jgi:kinesin family protein 20
MIGRENLHFAATRLNHHSSRSHCIFTIKAIRVAETAKPHLARVSMLSFCDLAGSERVKKAGNTGERQKEAGNINTSLLVLGRCIKAIRHNQLLKEVRKHQVVPFRESKLTRMFQSFLVGHGKASMVVNISQAPYLFDESLQVLKFAAVASKVTVVQKVETPETVKHPKKRKITRFSIMVGENKKNNPLMGRGSIAWDKPAARSTLCPTLHQSTFHHDDVDATFEDTTVVEENDERYDGLLKLIDNLKDQLIKEKQEKLTMEAEVRTELCEEFNQMMVEIESGWERRLQDQKERSKELSDWQISKLEEAYKNKKRKRAEVSSTAAAAEPGPMGNETALFQRDELEVQLEEKETELKCLKEKVSAMMDAHKCMSEEGKKRQEELAKKTHEGAKMGDRVEAMEAELKEARAEAESANAAKMASVESNSPDPIIEDLGRQLRESEDKRSELTVKNANMKELLDEAGEDFYEKVTCNF